jgi:hypothetical protein
MKLKIWGEGEMGILLLVVTSLLYMSAILPDSFSQPARTLPEKKRYNT